MKFKTPVRRAFSESGKVIGMI